jgi:hypothetical protein
MSSEPEQYLTTFLMVSRPWLLAAALLCQAATVRGEWKVFDVKDYGAVGDGTTKDTAAIREASFPSFFGRSDVLEKVTKTLRLFGHGSIVGVAWKPESLSLGM